jgi:hypothetical protein
MKEIRFGSKDGKDVITIYDSDDDKKIFVAELLIPWQEAQTLFIQTVKDYIKKHDNDKKYY